jgi:hypothetical protein
VDPDPEIPRIIANQSVDLGFIRHLSEKISRPSRTYRREFQPGLKAADLVAIIEAWDQWAVQRLSRGWKTVDQYFKSRPTLPHTQESRNEALGLKQKWILAIHSRGPNNQRPAGPSRAPAPTPTPTPTLRPTPASPIDQSIPNIHNHPAPSQTSNSQHNVSNVLSHSSSSSSSYKRKEPPIVVDDAAPSQISNSQHNVSNVLSHSSSSFSSYKRKEPPIVVIDAAPSQISNSQHNVSNVLSHSSSSSSSYKRKEPPGEVNDANTTKRMSFGGPSRRLANRRPASSFATTPAAVPVAVPFPADVPFPANALVPANVPVPASVREGGSKETTFGSMEERSKMSPLEYALSFIGTHQRMTFSDGA